MSDVPVLGPDELEPPTPDSPQAPAIGADRFRTDRGKLSATLVAQHVALGLGQGLDGTYFEYRAGVWQRSPDAVTRRVAQALGDEYSPTVEKQVRAHLLNLALPEVGVRRIDGALPYVVLANGVYHWAEDAFRQHRPDLLAMTKLPIEYDAAATCPRFDSWLLEVMSDDLAMVELAWEVIGYCLMSGNPYQKAVLLYGEGRNGKGTFLRVLGRMLGQENYSSLSLHTLVEDRFSAASLFGMIANISGDLSDRFVKQPEIIKQITGGDAITASHKYGQAFTFAPYAVPIFASNSRFRSSDTSHGWRRRWLVLEFLHRFDEGPFDEEHLFAETPGIFNAAMTALRRLTARGRFDPPPAAAAAAARLHDEGDPVLLWLDEDPSVTRGEDCVAPASDVYASYAAWSRRNGYQPIASFLLGKRLAERGFTRTRPRVGAHRVWHYVGISIVSPPQP